jgi:hypothetical protein
MSVFHDEVEIEDFEYDEDSDTYYYPCPCGDQFQITRVSYCGLGAPPSCIPQQLTSCSAGRFREW